MDASHRHNLRWPRIVAVSQQLLHNRFLFLSVPVLPVKDVSSVGNIVVFSQQSLSHFNEAYLLVPSVSVQHKAVANILSESVGISLVGSPTRTQIQFLNFPSAMMGHNLLSWRHQETVSALSVKISSSFKLCQKSLYGAVVIWLEE